MFRLGILAYCFATSNQIKPLRFGIGICDCKPLFGISMKFGKDIGVSILMAFVIGVS